MGSQVTTGFASNLDQLRRVQKVFFFRPIITIGKTKVVHAIEGGSNCIR